MLNGGRLYLLFYSQLSPAWRQMSHLSRSCCCWWSFWSGLSSCRTPCPPPLRKVNLTEGSLCPLAGRDGGPDGGCGCGGFLSRATSSPVQHRHNLRSSVGQQPRSTSPLWQAAKGFRFLPHTYFQTTDSTGKKDLPRILGMVPLCFTACFFPPDEWRGGEKVKSNVLFIRAMPTWQRFSVTFRLLVHKGPVFELWCLLNPTHPADMQTHTHKHTGTHWHSWQTAMPLWLCQIQSMIKWNNIILPKHTSKSVPYLINERNQMKEIGIKLEKKSKL